ncbi:MAG: DNA-3-methyladenine glycosylase [Planctomycetaceae bacterium]|nr:DNA-3-methyladenine glycosylase [Planctomycetaceae bacterium]
MSDSETLPVEFFQRSHLTVAEALIGCTLVWDGVGGIVVETEAYAAEGDAACHTSFRPSARDFFARHSPGTAYVYLNYGVHWLLNVLTEDGIVLLRALQPTRGLKQMARRRGKSGENELCSGPGKIGQALRLSGRDHGTSLLTLKRCFLRRAPDIRLTVCSDYRVGLSRAVDYPWRFLAEDHPCVSVPRGKAQNKPSRSGKGRYQGSSGGSTKRCCR